jgi:hypothetical protein
MNSQEADEWAWYEPVSEMYLFFIFLFGGVGLNPH